MYKASIIIKSDGDHTEEKDVSICRHYLEIIFGEN